MACLAASPAVTYRPVPARAYFCIENGIATYRHRCHRARRNAEGTNVPLVGRAVDFDQGQSTAAIVASPRTGRCSMRAGIDNDRELLELAQETERVASCIDDTVIRTRLYEIAGDLRERAISIPA